MKREYEQPTAKVIAFPEDDAIRTSKPTVTNWGEWITDPYGGDDFSS
ncbi:MAG: hypothetical protein IJX88_06040 [Clostridia bacterium]|nr:hypothetical protein [Clostridia bacterium]